MIGELGEEILNLSEKISIISNFEIEDNKVFIYSNKKYLNLLITKLNEELTELLEYLKHNLLFKDEEYYDYYSIYDMYEYCLNNTVLLFFIRKLKNLFQCFISVLSLKTILTEKEYKEYYTEFTSELIRVEEDFYTRVCKETIDNETFCEILNILNSLTP